MIDLDKLTDDELAVLGSRVGERRAALATAKAKIDSESETFDTNDIRIGMSEEQRNKAFAAVRKALGGER